MLCAYFPSLFTFHNHGCKWILHYQPHCWKLLHTLLESLFDVFPKGVCHVQSRSIGCRLATKVLTTGDVIWTMHPLDLLVGNLHHNRKTVVSSLQLNLKSIEKPYNGRMSSKAAGIVSRPCMQGSWNHNHVKQGSAVCDEPNGKSIKMAPMKSSNSPQLQLSLGWWGVGGLGLYKVKG